MSIAAAPEGRLWVMWDVGGKIYATRTNHAATRVGPPSTLGPPGSKSVYGFLDGEGSSGPLDLIANDGQGLWHQQVWPKLQVSGKRAGKTIVFTVADAGDPVAAAKVRVGGKNLTTAANGRAILANTPPGRVKASASKAGYTAACDDCPLSRVLGLPRARRLDALRLARHLREVRRIRRLATPAASSRSTQSKSTRGRRRASSIPAWTSPSSANRAGIVAMREVLGREIGELVPAERRGDGRVGPRAHRVRGRDRAVARVLVVVDEDALAALLLPPRRRDELRRAPLDLAREGERAAAHLRKPQFGSMRQAMWMPRFPDVFGQPM